MVGNDHAFTDRPGRVTDTGNGEASLKLARRDSPQLSGCGGALGEGAIERGIGAIADLLV